MFLNEATLATQVLAEPDTARHKGIAYMAIGDGECFPVAGDFIGTWKCGLKAIIGELKDSYHHNCGRDNLKNTSQFSIYYCTCPDCREEDVSAYLVSYKGGTVCDGCRGGHTS